MEMMEWMRTILALTGIAAITLGCVRLKACIYERLGSRKCGPCLKNN